MKTIWAILRGILVSIGLVVVMLALAGVWGLHRQQETLPRDIVLSYTFYGTPPDDAGPSPLMAQFFPSEPSLAEVAGTLYRAARDKHVSALAVRLAGGDYAWADVQELRAAIAAFRAAGKKAYVFAESYGELYPGMAEYYLASAFDEIWIQPVGTVAITGFSAEAPYIRKTLNMIGVAPEVIQKGTYKTAPESALLEHMSDAQRDTLHDILSSMMTDFFEGVSGGRHIPPVRIGQLVDDAPYTAGEAKERGLVDRVGYWDEWMDALLPQDAHPERDLVDIGEYNAARARDPLNQILKKEKQRAENKSENNGVALIYVGGMIVQDDGYDNSGPFGDRMSYATDIADALDAASQDDTVKAVVLRVDSPGGSPSASETIRRAVEVAKQRGKYVVVSMGDEAASGGYWLSVDADRIFAQPGTLTGSIGVFGGKASLAGLWGKIGTNWDSVTLGANASMWSMNQPYTDAQRQAVSRMLDDVYDSFIDRVARGRHFAPEVVESMAQGRVWTGRQAKERGLVDELGGLHQALEDVAKKIGVGDAGALDIRVMPDQPGPFDSLMGFIGRSAQAFEPIRKFIGAMVVDRHPALGLVRAPVLDIRS
ncbi:MAG: signal peptide peptidase SppA [Rhodospirillales bacterium]|nr:signal peptide peptidase SppA [Alphaproteobacteria bacterium]MCB9987671.1 signal peptide peptidase SppA [Rhodospirillales bacterium]USO08028.1 MAG: signal peptide peptidase SppA [Rhodospirillales bacterium]